MVRQVEEVSHHLGEQPLTVAPTPVKLGVSAPSTRFKLLKTTNCQLPQAKSLKNGQLGETPQQRSNFSVTEGVGPRTSSFETIRPREGKYVGL